MNDRNLFRVVHVCRRSYTATSHAVAGTSMAHRTFNGPPSTLRARAIDPAITVITIAVRVKSDKNRIEYAPRSTRPYSQCDTSLRTNRYRIGSYATYRRSWHLFVLTSPLSHYCMRPPVRDHDVR